MQHPSVRASSPVAIVNRRARRVIAGAVLVAASMLAPALDAHAQVNTEALRRESAHEGFENNIALAFELQSGNSDFNKVSAGYRLDYRSGPVYSFLVGNYERGSGSKALFANDAFVHLRFTYALDSTYRLEAFAQKEFNDFIQLRDRELAGGGVRIRLISAVDSASAFTLHLGIGAMYESELELDPMDVRTNLVRSTNYLTIAWTISKLLHLGATSYYQIAPARTSDFRVLAESTLSIDISDILSLDTSVHYRFDHDPPAGIKRYDLHLINGLNIHF